jgi:hypothetical protein
MTWKQAMEHARWRAKFQLQKMYVRGYMRSGSSEWFYGVYSEPNPPINSPINDRNQLGERPWARKW